VIINYKLINGGIKMVDKINLTDNFSMSRLAQGFWRLDD
jgi:hypothetical protein